MKHQRRFAPTGGEIHRNTHRYLYLSIKLCFNF